MQMGKDIAKQHIVSNYKLFLKSKSGNIKVFCKKYDLDLNYVTRILDNAIQNGK